VYSSRQFVNLGRSENVAMKQQASCMLPPPTSKQARQKATCIDVDGVLLVAAHLEVRQRKYIDELFQSRGGG
jgi:hypothetical protein